MFLLVGFVSASQQLYYDFEDDVLDNWNSYDATNNGVTFTSDYPSFNQSGDGSDKSGTFVRADNDYLVTPTNSINLEDDSINFWWKHDSANPNYEYIVSDSNGACNDAGLNFIRSNNDGSLSVRISGGTQWNGATDYADGSWHMITYTPDGSDWILYVDGVQESTSNIGTYGVCKTVNIGRHLTSSNYYLDAGVDELKVYSNQELNITEIRNLYNCGDETSCSGGASYFDITANDFYNSTSLTNFSALLNGTLYNTTNGTINTDISSTAGVFNISFVPKEKSL